jgi:hypothetical protein
MRGGLRTRLILDSTRVTILGALEQLGWFDATIYDDPPGVRTHQPVRYVARPKNWDDVVEPNGLAITSEDISDNPAGLGGEVDDQIEIYIDLFAQDESFGWHLTGDIRDICLGRYPTLGRDAPWIDVYDLRQATPAPFTQIEIQDVRVDRYQGMAQPWQRYWFMIRLSLYDDYADEANAVDVEDEWAPYLAEAWLRVQAVEY